MVRASERAFRPCGGTAMLQPNGSTYEGGRTWMFAEILVVVTEVRNPDGSRAVARQPAIGLDQRRVIDLLAMPAEITRAMVLETHRRIQASIPTHNRGSNRGFSSP